MNPRLLLLSVTLSFSLLLIAMAFGVIESTVVHPITAFTHQLQDLSTGTGGAR